MMKLRPELVASYVIVGRVPREHHAHPGALAHVTYEITCIAGEQPRATIHASNLTPTEHAELAALIEDTIDRLDIPCRCGQSWLVHDAASPHGSNDGACRSFTAAAPIADKVPQ